MSSKLNHVKMIQKFIETITDTNDLHAVVIEGPPGWGKTTAVETALRYSYIPYIHLGSYSTPLNLYHSLYENHTSVVLIDDCASLFNDKISMALLKAATWPLQTNQRIVKWGSTSGQVETPEFEFSGKLIIVCNHFPRSPDGDAIRSRAFVKKVEINLNEAKEWIKSAASDPQWFENAALSNKVADFLIEKMNEDNLQEISFRTLRKGYRLAERHPEYWEELFNELIPTGIVSPEKFILELSNCNLTIREQERIFEEKTGLKRRSFYYYKKSLEQSILVEVPKEIEQCNES